MKSKINIFYIFFSALLLIIVYNLILPYSSMQNNGVTWMGMGMHGGKGVRNNSLYYYDLIPNLIIIIGLVLLSFLLVKLLFSSSKSACKRCGLPIENNEWKICPRCGQHIENKGGS